MSGHVLEYVLLAEWVGLGLVVVYRLVEREWRHRVVRRAARRILPVGPGSTVPPTMLGVPDVVRDRNRVVVVPSGTTACPMGCAGQGQPCWEFCSEASRRNFL